MSDFFIPLGGGDEVGASAYFLSIDGVRILLDCGARLKGEELYPDYERLLREIPDFTEIDLILISHGHYDHIGSFAKIAGFASAAEIVTTQDTKRLISLQLLEFGRISGRAESERVKNERYRLAQAVMARIQVQPVMRAFEWKGCRITFMPAGHMIGAVMIYLETRSHRILYTGDFSISTMFGFNGMKIADGVRPEILLLNAPNSYLDPEEWKSLPASLDDEYNEEDLFSEDGYSSLADRIRNCLGKGVRVYLSSKSVPRHLDLLWFLKNVFPETAVYLEPKSKAIADALSEMGYAIYGENMSEAEPVSGRTDSGRISGREESIPEYGNPEAGSAGRRGCIFVGQDLERRGCVTFPFDHYSLHASPKETLEFVEMTGAREVFLLHVFPNPRKKSLKDILEKENPEMSVIQAENSMKYYLKREKEMVHKKIFREVMQKELATAHEQMKEMQSRRAKGTKEWAAIYGSCMYPDQHPRAAHQRIQNSFVGKYSVSYDDYLDSLRTANLDAEEKRKYVLRLVDQGMTLLKRSLDGDKAAIQKYAEFTEDLEPRDRKSGKRIFLGKCMVVFMILMDADLKNEEYIPIVVTFGEVYCDRLLRSIRDGLLNEYGMRRRRRTARDVLKKTETALFESTEAAAGFDAAGDELEKLRFENYNYKNSLELVQAMLDELNETIDETAADARNAAIASFYSNMNSENYGNLLDSIELVERRLASLKEQKVKVAPQLMPLTIVFKQLLRFIRDCGITPIDTTGREFTAEAEELADYTYIGAAYEKTGEKKTVVVERPGWKFEDTVISLPTVREKEEEGGDMNNG